MSQTDARLIISILGMSVSHIHVGLFEYFFFVCSNCLSSTFLMELNIVDRSNGYFYVPPTQESRTHKKKGKSQN